MKKNDEVRKTGMNIRVKRAGKILALLLAVVLAVNSPLMSMASHAEGESGSPDQQTVQTTDAGAQTPAAEEPSDSAKTEKQINNGNV